jgi:hypothetical protein
MKPAEVAKRLSDSTEPLQGIFRRKVGRAFHAWNFSFLRHPLQDIVDVGAKSVAGHPLAVFLVGERAGAKVNTLGAFAFQYISKFDGIVPRASTGEYANQLGA